MIRTALSDIAFPRGPHRRAVGTRNATEGRGEGPEAGGDAAADHHKLWRLVRSSSASYKLLSLASLAASLELSYHGYRNKGVLGKQRQNRSQVQGQSRLHRALTLPNEAIVTIYMRHLQNRGVERVKLTDIYKTLRIIPGTLFVGKINKSHVSRLLGVFF